VVRPDVVERGLVRPDVVGEDVVGRNLDGRMWSGRVHPVQQRLVQRGLELASHRASALPRTGAMLGERRLNSGGRSVSKPCLESWR
jgi:hypothetical protein